MQQTCINKSFLMFLSKMVGDLFFCLILFICYEMQNRQEEESSEQQGFYKPQIKVQQDKQQSPPRVPHHHQFNISANDLVLYQRPIDFIPRVLTTTPPLRTQLLDLDLVVNSKGEELLPCKQQKTKRTKWGSLRDKYMGSGQYQMVYAKTGNITEFNSYIFPLNHTTDYNPNNYQPPLQPEQSPLNSQFDSNFESGNLLYAFTHTQPPAHTQPAVQEYDLILQNDTNTRGYNQWFYFSFRNHTQTTVKFNIVNLVKKHSLMEEGVRPVGFSLKESHKGWVSIGSNLEYSKSYIAREIHGDPPTYKNYYTLSFTINFSIQHDTLYMALNYPYTYSRMVKFMNQLPQLHPSLSISKDILCYSISNNAIPYFKIKTNNSNPHKKILVLARQHPGQTVGSFVLQGFIHSILKQQHLLKSYQLVVIPMVNPDGVIYGNFRTNLGGFDLNRQWVSPSKSMHPEIYYLLKLILGLQQVAMVIDFHGHSKKYNSFIYACSGDPIWPYRVFPYICSNHSQLFSIKDCTYNLTYDKERTARIRLFREIKHPHIYTSETSFFGYINKQGIKYRFQIDDLLQIGQGISSSLVCFLMKRKESLSYEKEVKQKEYLFDKWVFQNKDDIDSESNPSEDQLTPLERKEKGLIKEQKKQKSKKKISKKTSKYQNHILNFSARKSKVGEGKLLFQNSQKLKVPQSLPTAISKNQSQSERDIPLKGGKSKPKKIEKKMSILNPVPKQQPTSLQKIQTTQIKTNLARPPKDKIKPSIKAMSEPKKDNKLITMSNLFNTTSYYTQMHQKLLKRQISKHLQDKTQSLQITNAKRELPLNNGNTMDVIRKLIANEDESQKYYQIGARLKYKEKAAIIRENKIINSVNKAQQTQFKRNLEEDITNRTEALRNCQKKLNEISYEQGMLISDQSSYQMYKNLYSTATNSYKFPTIKRGQHFLF